MFRHAEKAARGGLAGGREESRKAVAPSLRFGFGLISAGSLTLAGSVARNRFQRWWRKDPVELERRRRLDINKRGRITEGQIGDVVQAETAGRNSWLAIYSYQVAGVSYEASQDLTALPEVAAVALFLCGSTVSVKYDPRRPGNSIIACEEWSGLGDVDWALRFGRGS